jgi:hypothetical protein
VSNKFGEWYQKTNKTEDTNKLTLLTFKIITILHNTPLATFIKLLETVCKMCAFHDAFQAGKQKEVHPPYSPDLVPAGARSGEYSGPIKLICLYVLFCCF